MAAPEVNASGLPIPSPERSSRRSEPSPGDLGERDGLQRPLVDPVRRSALASQALTIQAAATQGRLEVQAAQRLAACQADERTPAGRSKLAVPSENQQAQMRRSRPGR